MKPLRISLRVVFYKEEGRWIAHCLEFNLIGHGKTKRGALKMLSQAITIQFTQSVKHNNPKNLFSPADGKFFFANDVLKSPAQQMFRQEDPADPPARLQGGPAGGR